MHWWAPVASLLTFLLFPFLYFLAILVSLQVNSAPQSCLSLCDPMDCSMPGLPVHHQIPELIQTHVHRVGDAIQPSHPLLSPSPPTFILSQHQALSNESILHIRWPKYWSFSFSNSPSNEHAGLMSFIRSTGGNCQGDDRQESFSSAGNCQADEQTVITQLSRP